MGLNLFTVQPLFSGEVFAQYKLILLPFSVRNLIAPQPQTIVPNPIPPGTSPPPDELGEALFLFSFIPLYHHRKRQLPHLLTVHPFRDHAIYNEKYEVLQYFSHLTTHWNTIPPGTSPPPEGLGEALLLSLFYFGGAWGGSASLSILFCRGLGRPPFHFSNISVHSPTCSQILKI